MYIHVCWYNRAESSAKIWQIIYMYIYVPYASPLQPIVICHSSHEYSRGAILRLNYSQVVTNNNSKLLATNEVNCSQSSMREDSETPHLILYHNFGRDESQLS